MSIAAAPSNPAVAPVPSKGLHYGLWAVQGLLGLAFGMAGLMKMTQPLAELGKNMAWVNDLGMGTRFIGASEFLGALGVILPAALRIMPKLTGVAAAALTLVMVLAMGWHVKAGDAAHLAPSLVLGLLSAFVAWGRLVKAPIAPKS
jgi:putative oxidoreductase